MHEKQDFGMQVSLNARSWTDLSIASPRLISLLEGHEECGNPVHAKNLIWWLPKNRYAIVQIARGRLCTFVDYNHEVTNRKHFTVADMLADHSLLNLVYHVLTSQDDSKFPFKWQDGITFVSFNFGTWETKSKVQWRCHGHGQ